MRKKLIPIIILIVIVASLVIAAIKNNSVKASDTDVYDIILFWGQSNMTAWPNTEGDMPADFNSTNNFSKITDIDVDILANTKTTSLVNTPIEDNTAYIYKYLSNSFEKITSQTYILGDGFNTSEYRDGKTHGLAYNPLTGKLEKYVEGTSSHISIQTTENVNMIPEFCRTYYERTGHKVIAVTGAVGGAPIESFLPKDDANHKINGNTDYMYEAIKENFKGAVNLANSKGYNIGGKYWVSFQGESNVGDTAALDVSARKTNYEEYFTQVKNNLKNDLGITLGAITETAYTIGDSWSAIGVQQMHNSQEYLITNNTDIILGSSYAYDHYVPDETNYKSNSFTTKKYLDSAGNKLDYNTAFSQASKSVCYQQGNTIHFNSAALSQIGRDCANNIANKLGYSNNFDNLSAISYSSIVDDTAYYNNLQIPSNISAADPFLIKDGDTYYLYVTDNNYYTSNDLKNWSHKGAYISSVPSNVEIQYYWAPEVYKYNNKFYMIFSGIYWGNGYPYGMNGTNTSYGAIYLAETDNLAKGFTYVKKIEVGLENTLGSNVSANYSYIDGTFLFEENSIYMYFKSEEKQNIYVIELDSNFNKKTSAPTKLIDFDEKVWERHINEGPFVIKNNNTYYLMYSTGEYMNDCYSVGYATSSSPKGPFTKKTISGPFLYGAEPKYENEHYTFDSSKYIYGTGHNMILKVSDSEMYIVYHSATFDKNTYETIGGSDQKYSGKSISKYKDRKLNIDRVGVDASGNLYVNGPSDVNQPLPSGTISGGITYTQLGKNNYTLSIDNSSEVSYLSDEINYLTKNVTPKIATTRQVNIEFNKRKDITDIWLYGNGSSLGFNNATVDVSINDKYVIKDVALGNSGCFKLNIPYNVGNLKNEHIKSINIIADRDIALTEVKTVVTNAETSYEDKYTITFNSNGGKEASTTVTKDVGSTLGTLPTVTRTGYTLKGWFTSATGGTQVSSSTVVSGTAIYYAQWTPNTNTKYVVNHWQQNVGGTASSHDSTNYTKKDTDNLTGITASQVTPEVKTYTGFTSPSTQTVTIAADGSTVVNYYYTRNQYIITFNSNGGKEANTTVTKYEGSELGTLPTVTRAGYTLKGWFTSATGETQVSSSTVVSGTAIYYAQWTPNTNTKYIVNHWQQNIGGTASSHDSTNYTKKDTDNLTGITASQVTPEVKTYTGFTSPSTQTVTIAADGSTVVNYYYTRKQYKVTLAKDEGIDSVSGAGTYYYGQNVTINATVKENYIWVNWTGTNTYGNIKNTFVMPAGNIQFIANSIKSASVTTKYIDINTQKELAESITENGQAGTKYTTEEKEIEGYECIEIEGIKEGTMTSGEIEVIYYYAKKCTITVKYIDIYTQKSILENITIEGWEGKEYTTEEKIKNGYTFLNATNNTSGKMPRDNITVIYTYGKITKLEINYIDKTNNAVISEKKVIEGYVGEEYEVKPVQVEGYQYSGSSDNTSGIMTEETIEIKFAYLKKSGLTVKYVDINTNEEIEESKHYDCNSTENYDVTSDYKDISSYTFIKDSGNIKGTMTNETIDAIYYYAYNSSVIVKYYDIFTNKEITESELIEGYEGKDYSSQQKEIDGYQFTKVDKAEGKIERAQIEVKYYYTKRTSIKIQYIDYYANIKIADNKIIEGIEGQKYDITSEIKDIEGYVMIRNTNNAIGEFSNTNIEVRVYYAKKLNITIEIIDVKTNQEIEQLTIEGYEGKEYSLLEYFKDDKYQYVSASVNLEGKFTRENTNIKMYYEQKNGIKDDTIAEQILPNTGKRLTTILILVVIVISIILFISYKKY